MFTITNCNIVFSRYNRNICYHICISMLISVISIKRHLCIIECRFCCSIRGYPTLIHSNIIRITCWGIREERISVIHIQGKILELEMLESDTTKVFVIRGCYFHIAIAGIRCCDRIYFFIITNRTAISNLISGLSRVCINCNYISCTFYRNINSCARIELYIACTIICILNFLTRSSCINSQSNSSHIRFLKIHISLHCL